MDDWAPIDRSQRKSAIELMMESQGLDSSVLHDPATIAPGLQSNANQPIELPPAPLRRSFDGSSSTMNYRTPQPASFYNWSTGPPRNSFSDPKPVRIAQRDVSSFPYEDYREIEKRKAKQPSNNNGSHETSNFLTNFKPVPAKKTNPLWLSDDYVPITKDMDRTDFNSSQRQRSVTSSGPVSTTTIEIAPPSPEPPSPPRSEPVAIPGLLEDDFPPSEPMDEDMYEDDQLNNEPTNEVIERSPPRVEPVIEIPGLGSPPPFDEMHDQDLYDSSSQTDVYMDEEGISQTEPLKLTERSPPRREEAVSSIPGLGSPPRLDVVHDPDALVCGQYEPTSQPRSFEPQPSASSASTVINDFNLQLSNELSTAVDNLATVEPISSPRLSSPSQLSPSPPRFVVAPVEVVNEAQPGASTSKSPSPTFSASSSSDESPSGSPHSDQESSKPKRFKIPKKRKSDVDQSSAHTPLMYQLDPSRQHDSSEQQGICLQPGPSSQQGLARPNVFRPITPPLASSTPVSSCINATPTMSEQTPNSSLPRSILKTKKKGTSLKVKGSKKTRISWGSLHEACIPDDHDRPITPPVTSRAIPDVNRESADPMYRKTGKSSKNSQPPVVKVEKVSPARPKLTSTSTARKSTSAQVSTTTTLEEPPSPSTSSDSSDSLTSSSSASPSPSPRPPSGSTTCELDLPPVESVPLVPDPVNGSNTSALSTSTVITMIPLSKIKKEKVSPKKRPPPIVYKVMPKCLNCDNAATEHPDWDDEYCSSRCLITYVKRIFNHHINLWKEKAAAAANNVSNNVSGNHEENQEDDDDVNNNNNELSTDQDIRQP